MTTPKPEDVAPQSSAATLVIVRGLGGAILGGLLGYLAFRWLYSQGFYGLMLPGVLLGLGAGLAARGTSQALGIVCGVAALALGTYAEWSVAPFRQDSSLWFFITHMHHLSGVKLLMLVLGAACGYWFGRGR
jgi:hypothetical protein